MRALLKRSTCFLVLFFRTPRFGEAFQGGNSGISPHLQSAVVEEHDEGMFGLDPLEQQRRRTSDVLLA